MSTNIFKLQRKCCLMEMFQVLILVVVVEVAKLHQ